MNKANYLYYEYCARRLDQGDTIVLEDGNDISPILEAAHGTRYIITYDNQTGIWEIKADV